MPIEYKEDPCPGCGGKVKIRSNRSRYCSECFSDRYLRDNCPGCGGKKSKISSKCSSCRNPLIPPRQMTDSEIAWVAGIVEGEGYIAKDRCRLAVVMTDRDVIERLHQTTGLGKAIYDRPGRKIHHKPDSIWYVYRREHVTHILTLIIPWLGARRRNSAFSMAKSCGLALPPGLEPGTPRLTAAHSAN